MIFKIFSNQNNCMILWFELHLFQCWLKLFTESCSVTYMELQWFLSCSQNSNNHCTAGYSLPLIVVLSLMFRDDKDQEAVTTEVVLEGRARWRLSHTVQGPAPPVLLILHFYGGGYFYLQCYQFSAQFNRPAFYYFSKITLTICMLDTNVVTSCCSVYDYLNYKKKESSQFSSSESRNQVSWSCIYLSVHKWKFANHT